MANLPLLNLSHTLTTFSSRTTIKASSNGVPFSKPKSGGPMILEIPLDKIRRPLMRTRANDPEKVKDLMESINQIRLQEPLIDSRISTFRSAVHLSTCLDVIHARIPEDEADEESTAPAIIYEDKDTDEEEEDAMETDEDNDDLGAIGLPS